MVNELSEFFVSSANPVGGIVDPMDVKVLVTVGALGPTHAGRFRVLDSVM